MEQTTYASRLRYLDADDLDDSVIDFDGLDVRGSDDAKLGDVDGFLVDPASNRVLYAVVDSGGWFSSRRFLVPIGHATVDREAGALRVDVAKDTLGNYPEFDEGRFTQFSDDEFRTYESRMAGACCPNDHRDPSTSAFDSGRHYAQPAWWSAKAYTADRLRPVEPRPYHSRTVAAPVTETRTRDTYNRDLATARGEERLGDVSPHVDGRAQPGDILGIETGGETTSIGDTAEDEDKRRRDAERALRNDSDLKR